MAALEERIQRVIRILRRMPARNRTVFVLHVIDNLPYAVIAARLNISVEQVRRRLVRAYNFYIRTSRHDDEQLESPLTQIAILNRVRSDFCG